MTKADLRQNDNGKWVVRDSKSGRFVEVRGANALSDNGLRFEKGIDLTRPIAEQVMRKAHQASQAQKKT